MPNLGPGTMQEHSLIGLRKVERVTDLVRAPALDVAEGDHLALDVGQRIDGPVDHGARLGGEKLVLGAPPLLWRRRPVAPPAVLRATEALGRDRRPRVLHLFAHERRERHRAALPNAAGLREVRDDAEEPGAQRRATLEAVDAAEDAEPRFLYDLFRHGPLADVETCDPKHRRPMLLHERGKGALVALPERVEQL